MNIMLDKGAFAPEYAHFGWDAGADLKSPVEVIVPARGSVVIDTGVHVQIPQGFVGMIKSKSGLNVKHDITSEGVVDAGYNGSIRVKLYNHGYVQYRIKRGDKISQLCIMPVHCEPFEIVSEFEETERGNNGFGSTGR